jgi:hypothetical protein
VRKKDEAPGRATCIRHHSVPVQSWKTAIHFSAFSSDMISGFSTGDYLRYKFFFIYQGEN